MGSDIDLYAKGEVLYEGPLDDFNPYMLREDEE